MREEISIERFNQLQEEKANRNPLQYNANVGVGVNSPATYKEEISMDKLEEGKSAFNFTDESEESKLARQFAGKTLKLAGNKALDFSWTALNPLAPITNLVSKLGYNDPISQQLLENTKNAYTERENFYIENEGSLDGTRFANDLLLTALDPKEWATNIAVTMATGGIANPFVKYGANLLLDSTLGVANSQYDSKRYGDKDLTIDEMKDEFLTSMVFSIGFDALGSAVSKVNSNKITKAMGTDIIEDATEKVNVRNMIDKATDDVTFNNAHKQRVQVDNPSAFIGEDAYRNTDTSILGIYNETQSTDNPMMRKLGEVIVEDESSKTILSRSQLDTKLKPSNMDNVSEAYMFGNALINSPKLNANDVIDNVKVKDLSDKIQKSFDEYVNIIEDKKGITTYTQRLEKEQAFIRNVVDYVDNLELDDKVTFYSNLNNKDMSYKEVSDLHDRLKSSKVDNIIDDIVESTMNKAKSKYDFENLHAIGRDTSIHNTDVQLSLYDKVGVKVNHVIREKATEWENIVGTHSNGKSTSEYISNLGRDGYDLSIGILNDNKNNLDVTGGIMVDNFNDYSKRDFTSKKVGHIDNLSKEYRNMFDKHNNVVYFKYDYSGNKKVNDDIVINLSKAYNKGLDKCKELGIGDIDINNPKVKGAFKDFMELQSALISDPKKYVDFEKMLSDKGSLYTEVNLKLEIDRLEKDLTDINKGIKFQSELLNEEISLRANGDMLPEGYEINTTMTDDEFKKATNLISNLNSMKKDKELALNSMRELLDNNLEINTFLDDFSKLESKYGIKSFVDILDFSDMDSLSKAKAINKAINDTIRINSVLNKDELLRELGSYLDLEVNDLVKDVPNVKIKNRERFINNIIPLYDEILVAPKGVDIARLSDSDLNLLGQDIARLIYDIKLTENVSSYGGSRLTLRDLNVHFNDGRMADFLQAINNSTTKRNIIKSNAQIGDEVFVKQVIGNTLYDLTGSTNVNVLKGKLSTDNIKASMVGKLSSENKAYAESIITNLADSIKTNGDNLIDNLFSIKGNQVNEFGKAVGIVGNIIHHTYGTLSGLAEFVANPMSSSASRNQLNTWGDIKNIKRQMKYRIEQAKATVVSPFKEETAFGSSNMNLKDKLIHAKNKVVDSINNVNKSKNKVTAVGSEAIDLYKSTSDINFQVRSENQVTAMNRIGAINELSKYKNLRYSEINDKIKAFLKEEGITDKNFSEWVKSLDKSIDFYTYKVSTPNLMYGQMLDGHESNFAKATYNFLQYYSDVTSNNRLGGMFSSKMTSDINKISQIYKRHSQRKGLEYYTRLFYDLNSDGVTVNRFKNYRDIWKNDGAKKLGGKVINDSASLAYGGVQLALSNKAYALGILAMYKGIQGVSLPSHIESELDEIKSNPLKYVVSGFTDEVKGMTESFTGGSVIEGVIKSNDLTDYILGKRTMQIIDKALDEHTSLDFDKKPYGMSNEQWDNLKAIEGSRVSKQSKEEEKKYKQIMIANSIKDYATDNLESYNKAPKEYREIVEHIIETYNIKDADDMRMESAVIFNTNKGNINDKINSLVVEQVKDGNMIDLNKVNEVVNNQQEHINTINTNFDNMNPKAKETFFNIMAMTKGTKDISYEDRELFIKIVRGMGNEVSLKRLLNNYDVSLADYKNKYMR